MRPRILVFSTLFPNEAQPSAGLFIRERMFRVAAHCPLIVVSPKPWFPLQSLLRVFKPGYRPTPRHKEIQENIVVHFPRFLSLPFVLRGLDGFSMAVCSWLLMRKLKKQFNFNIIDAHFAYPDGFAASKLGKWFDVPVTITLRGTEVPHAKTRRRAAMLSAMNSAKHIFSVAGSLKRFVSDMGVDASKIEVVGNGVDIEKFYPMSKHVCRQQLNLRENASVIISIGGLVERKGMHRVIECLPDLLILFPDLHYLIVGGASGEGDWTERLKQQVSDLGLKERVRFLGFLAPHELKEPLSAADLFVLSTRNEGWANVFLEAMACGLPVITTDVGGNSEVVSSSELGTVIPFGDKQALVKAISDGLSKQWDRKRILQYAADNSWDNRIDSLVSRFNALV